MEYTTPLIILGVFMAIPGIFAWAHTTRRGLAGLFRAGPIFLIPLVIMWAAISNELCPAGEQCPDLWRRLPIYAAEIGTALWQFVLISISTDRQRILYILYAVAYLPAFYLFCGFALAIATRFPL
jgi:hypothetical protein